MLMLCLQKFALYNLVPCKKGVLITEPIIAQALKALQEIQKVSLMNLKKSYCSHKIEAAPVTNEGTNTLHDLS